MRFRKIPKDSRQKIQKNQNGSKTIRLIVLQNFTKVLKYSERFHTFLEDSMSTQKIPEHFKRFRKILKDFMQSHPRFHFKIYGVPGLGEFIGGGRLFCKKKGGGNIFDEKRGAHLFFFKKRGGGAILFCLKKVGLLFLFHKKKER